MEHSILAAADESKQEPKIGPPLPSPVESPKHRRPLTPEERRKLEEKIERAKKTDPNIYPLW